MNPVASPPIQAVARKMLPRANPDSRSRLLTVTSAAVSTTTALNNNPTQ